MLKELHDLALREELIGDPAFEVRPVAWIITLKADGEFLSMVGTHEAEELPENSKKKKPKEFAKKFRVPRMFNPDTGGARSGITPFAFFLVDKSEYLLGCAAGAKAGTVDPRFQKTHAAFIEKVRIAYNATGEDRLNAVLTFLERVKREGPPIDIPAKTAAGDLYAFVVRPDQDSLLHEAPAIREYWTRICAGGGDGAGDWQCLITGQTMGAPGLFPMLKRVPGAQAQSGLVSFTPKAFESYGWVNNANAPVSPDAAQAATVALNRLLDPAFQKQDGTVMPKRHKRLGEDAVACYWVAGGGAQAEEFANEMELGVEPSSDPGGRPGELWRAAWDGKTPQLLDGKFFAVTLAGAQGRAIVRDWYETTVAKVQESVAIYFRQLSLTPNTPPSKTRGLPPHYALRIIRESLIASNKADDLPSKITQDLYLASIDQRRRFPSALLAMALGRMRAEIGRDDWIDSYRRDARTALIKAILTRESELSPDPTHMTPLTPDLDETNKDLGYLLGCLFACIERMQYLALGNVNANVANRYFATASSTPLHVLSALMRDFSGHYLKKALRRSGGQAMNLSKRVEAIHLHLAKLSPPGDTYPERLSPRDQGLFMVGYHVQRGAFRRGKPDEVESPDVEIPASDELDLEFEA